MQEPQPPVDTFPGGMLISRSTYNLNPLPGLSRPLAGVLAASHFKHIRPWGMSVTGREIPNLLGSKIAPSKSTKRHYAVWLLHR